MKIIIYGKLIGCGKCAILKEKLEEKNIEFEFIDNIKEVKKIGIANKILSIPIMDVDGKIMKYLDAIKFIRRL